MIQPLRPPAPSHPAQEQPRLGGALAILFWCACGITAVPIAGLFALIADLGAQGAVSALFDSFAGPAATQVVLRLGLLPQLVLFAFAVAMVGLTVARSRLALTVLPWMLVLWVAASVYSQFAIRNALTPGGADLGAFAGLLPALLAQGIGVAAFFGYFREGRRPQAFYRR